MSNKHIRFDDDDEEEEVFGIQSDDDQSDIALSDIEGQDNDDDLPNIKAWGKDKRKYYHTDYVDQDYGGFQGKDAVLAELEEEEARNLQKQLISELDEGDFSLEMFTKTKDSKEDNSVIEEVVKTDISKLSQRQKLQLLKKESPEFFELVEDFKEKFNLMKNLFKPVLNLSRNNNINDSNALQCVKLYNNLILNYCTNICMYLLLKSTRTPMQHHPIIKRLFQYRQQLMQMEPVLEVVKPQIEALLELKKDESVKTSNIKVLKVLSDLKKVNEFKETALKPKGVIKNNEETEEKQTDKQKAVKFADDLDEIDNNEDIDEEEQQELAEEGGKRSITYQMAKNKGLTPHRKKEQRNPRVKHRNKFRKAKIRRKGAVREVRHETTRYSGEISGIKAFVTKSIKLK